MNDRDPIRELMTLMGRSLQPDIWPGKALPIFIDKKPGWIVGMAEEDTGTVVDIIMKDTGSSRWCTWPSHRIEARDGNDPAREIIQDTLAMCVKLRALKKPLEHLRDVSEVHAALRANQFRLVRLRAYKRTGIYPTDGVAYHGNNQDTKT